MITRLILIWNGIMSELFSDYAARHPKIFYRGLLAKQYKKREELLEVGGDALGHRNERHEELVTAQSQLAAINTKLAGAMRDQNVKLGAALLEKKKLLETQVAELTAQVAQLDKSYENFKEDLKAFNRHIANLQQEAVVNTARMKSAEAQAKIMDTLSGLSVDTEDQMLQDMRQRINSRVAQVQIRQEIDDVGNLDRQIRKEEASAEKSGFEAEFEAMMREQQAAQSTHAAQAPPADGGKQP